MQRRFNVTGQIMAAGDSGIVDRIFSQLYLLRGQSQLRRVFIARYNSTLLKEKYVVQKEQRRSSLYLTAVVSVIS